MDLSEIASNPLFYSLLISLGIQASFFIIAAILKTDLFTDLSYGITFVILAIAIVAFNQSSSLMQWLLTGMIAFWGLRLAGYLFIRISSIKRDKRFDGIRENPLKFGAFWLFQGISIWIIMLPSLHFLGAKIEPTGLYISLFGFLIWAVGFVLETVADYQKFVFKQQNKNMWISSGVWKYSRHPNYLGELFCWWGIFLFVVPYLSGWEYLTIIGPIWITILLLFITGVPTIEKRYDKKYKSNKKYQEYKCSTGLLFPKPSSIGTSSQ